MKVLLVLLFSFSLHAETPLEKTVDQIVSVFENASTEIRYDYIENIHDGRGFTAGKVGFTTGTGDLLDLVMLYEKKNPASSFTPFVKILKERSDQHSGSVQGLKSLPQIWKKACKDKVFISAQDELSENLYKTPARDRLKDFNLNSPLAYLIFYDTVVQHGDGDDPDSFDGILKIMKDTDLTEEKFLRGFLLARKKVLLNPSDQSTAKEWAESVDRVQALSNLIDEGKWNLSLPLTIRVWEKGYKIL